MRVIRLHPFPHWNDDLWWLATMAVACCGQPTRCKSHRCTLKNRRRKQQSQNNGRKSVKTISLQPWRCAPSHFRWHIWRKSWCYYSNQYIIHRGWRILIPYEDKVDDITPVNILFIGGILMRWWSQRPGWGERFKTLVPRLCKWTEIRCSPSPRRDEPSYAVVIFARAFFGQGTEAAAGCSDFKWAALRSIEQHWVVFQCVAMCRNIQLPVASLEPYAKDPFDEHGLSTWILRTASRSALPVVICKSFDLFEPIFKTVRVYCAFPEFRILAFGEEYVESELPNPVRSTQRLPGRLSLEIALNISYASILPISMFRAATYGWWLRLIEDNLERKNMKKPWTVARTRRCHYSDTTAGLLGLIRLTKDCLHQLAFAHRNG